MKRILLTSVLAGLMLASSAMALFIDPRAALKDINDYRTKIFADARAENKTPNLDEVNAEVKKRALLAVNGESADKIAPADGYVWAQLFQLAGDLKSACKAAERFVDTGPTAAEKYSAQALMLSCCNTMGEGDMVAKLLNSMEPPIFAQQMALATSTAGLYVDTVRSSMGTEAALQLLSQMEVKVRAANTANDQEVTRKKGSIASLVTAKAEILNETGKRNEAVRLLDNLVSEFGEKSPEARSVTSLKNRILLIGSPAPAVTFERSHGEFKGLESLKGKVVILDFFAHWCGPCIRSFPDMKKLYSDYKDKGLEIVGLTTYYGYYKTENQKTRDMPKDTEFGKMSDFIKEHELPWPVVYGERTNFEAYGVTGIPHVAVIDRQGNVKKIKIGYSPASFAEFRKEIEHLINEK